MADTRNAVLRSLSEIISRGSKPKDALGMLPGDIATRDRAFIMEIVYGVLRNRDTLDWIIRKLLDKPRMPGPRTLNNLRAGTYQILYMRVPEWASVNEAVRVEKTHKGLVNAVLRNVARQRVELLAGLDLLRERLLRPENGNVSVSDISVLTSHPEWLIRRWIKRFGPEEAFELASANNVAPCLTLRVNTLRTTRLDVLGRLREMGIDAAPTQVSPDGVMLNEHIAFSGLEPLGGLVMVQDEAAQLITYMLGPGPGERVLDACAAPGGKTTHIAELMGDRGEVVALDLNEDRIKLLDENVARMGLSSVRAVKGDITSPGDTGKLGEFDRILIDAPCSATGTIRRNPDVKHRCRRKDLGKFRKRQVEMLRSASALLRPGGTLVFCTCSTEPDEGEDVIGEFLKSSGDFYIIKDVPVVGRLLANGYLRTYAHRHGMDGFFGTRLGKK
jgi:16S rRNA (cytosine967-C5)-methyltransferase